MGAYVATLCTKCKQPIGHLKSEVFHNEETGVTFLWHNDGRLDCWEQFIKKSAEEYMWFMLRIQRKEIQK